MESPMDPTNTEAVLKILEELTNNADHIQQQILEEILQKNANTEYLKGFLDGQSQKEHFKKKVPVVDYKYIKPYIDRIANGEPSQILSADNVTELLLSSGTSSGKQKLIPTTAEERSRKAFFQYIGVSILARYIDGLFQGNWMYFIFVGPETYTPGNLVVRFGTTSHLKAFMKPEDSSVSILTSPAEVFLCLDVNQSMYCQLLCGLVKRDKVVRVGASFASGFLRIIKFLKDHWQELCSNIRKGYISDQITDPDCRKAVSLILSKEMPNLADSIEEECKRESWEGIIKKLWPKSKLIDVVITGCMAQYIPVLEFFTGSIPLVSLHYASSEGYFGLNLKPLSKPCDVSYTLLPKMAFFEFLPVNHSNEEVQDNQQKNPCDPNSTTEKDNHIEDGIVDLVDVKMGQCYELVVTTFTGLYRYRVGDILMVTGFHNKAPRFKFIQRQNVVLSVDLDKTTEEDLLKAITNAMHIIEPHGFILTDYTSYTEISSVPGHYVLFWELQMKVRVDQYCQLETSEMEKCCAAVEQSLDSQYRMLRRKGDHVVGPLEIRVVKNGTFNVLMDFYLSQGSSMSQYKTPKCIMSEKAIEILNSRVMGSFFSQN